MTAYSEPQVLNTTLELAEKYNCKIFIETGTQSGENISLVSKHFDKCFSIEIDEGWFNMAMENNKDNDNVYLYHGCSSVGLSEILEDIDEPYIIFLDAHWWNTPDNKLINNYNPILEEFSAISKRREVYDFKPPIIVHDFFVPDESNPSTAKFSHDGIFLQQLIPSLDLIYGKGEWDYHYSTEANVVPCGVLYAYPKD